MVSTRQLKIGSSVLLVAGVGALVSALAGHQPLLLFPGAVLIGLGRTGWARALRRTLPR